MRSHQTHVIAAMGGMLEVFSVACADKQTLQKLAKMASDRGKWRDARALFQEIRRKALAAGRRNDEVALAQYEFEEICAKTLHNMTKPEAPFDPDAPFWILPLAVQLGRKLGMTDTAKITPLLEMGTE